jgi:hypothetical protein
MLFDALYAVGQTAVPINMMILGCNLSASQMNHYKQKEAAANSRHDHTNVKQDHDLDCHWQDDYHVYWYSHGSDL